MKDHIINKKDANLLYELEEDKLSPMEAYTKIDYNCFLENVIGKTIWGYCLWRNPENPNGEFKIIENQMKIPQVKKNTPSGTAKTASDRLLGTITLDGYYKIDYYTGEITVCGVYLPNGLCVCRKYNQTMNEYDNFDLEWDNFSEYTQRMILLEVGNKYIN